MCFLYIKSPFPIMAYPAGYAFFHVNHCCLSISSGHLKDSRMALPAFDPCAADMIFVAEKHVRGTRWAEYDVSPADLPPHNKRNEQHDQPSKTDKLIHVIPLFDDLLMSYLNQSPANGKGALQKNGLPDRANNGGRPFSSGPLLTHYTVSLSAMSKSKNRLSQATRGTFGLDRTSELA
jgi:hypothetical protein